MILCLAALTQAFSFIRAQSEAFYSVSQLFLCNAISRLGQLAARLFSGLNHLVKGVFVKVKCWELALLAVLQYFSISWGFVALIHLIHRKM